MMMSPNPDLHSFRPEKISIKYLFMADPRAPFCLPFFPGNLFFWFAEIYAQKSCFLIAFGNIRHLLRSNKQKIYCVGKRDPELESFMLGH